MKTERPVLYISSAAIGYYGDRQSEWMTEASKPGSGFLSESCIAWENAIQEVAQTGIRTVAFRIGIVLSKQGGALPKLVLPTHLGVAPYFGQGQQWYSWIHIDDLCSMFLYAIDNKAVSQLFMHTPQEEGFSLQSLFSTHPPIEKRIQILEQYV